MKNHELLKSVAAFTAHIIAGVVMFSMVAFAALIIHALRVQMIKWGVDPMVVHGFEAMEIFVFLLDIAMLGIWSVKSTINFIDDLKE